MFYVSPDLDEDIVNIIRELIAGDRRFFLPSQEEVESTYNYNDNTVLVRAIENSAGSLL